VKLATPRWWYVKEGAPAPLVRGLLSPVSAIWTWATARRIRRGRPYDPGVPVICVGGLTMGGTGKTPVARALLQRLAGQGAFGLTRGYGGRLQGPLRVSTQHKAAEVGDEPLLLARDAPVVVARDRAAGARLAVAEGARLLVLDDGHQNPALLKTLSIVVVDGETRNNEWPFGDGAVFPSGPMREPLPIGLARADAVVVLLPADLAEPDPRLLALLDSRPVLIARLQPVAPPPSGPQLGFAGVAKPWKVERALKAAGCQLVDFAPFPDHGAYDAGTLSFLADRAASLGAGLVTTEKDWVRLPPEWRERVTAWPVEAVFEDAAALAGLLAPILRHPRT
jgi:tetraacyldisaccharide 4'-kinase